MWTAEVGAGISGRIMHTSILSITTSIRGGMKSYVLKGGSLLGRGIF